MTEVNQSQYFVLYFHNPHYKRFMPARTHTRFFKTWSKTNIFIKFTSIAFNSEHNLSGIYMFIPQVSHRSCLFV